MKTAGPPPLLDHIDDEELERLAVAWRAQALRGDRKANGTAHALEVERRQRLRSSQMALLPVPAALPRRHWWNFWKRKGDDPAHPLDPA